MQTLECGGCFALGIVEQQRITGSPAGLSRPIATGNEASGEVSANDFTSCAHHARNLILGGWQVRKKLKFEATAPRAVIGNRGQPDPFPALNLAAIGGDQLAL